MNLLEKLAFHIAFDTFVLCHAIVFAVVTVYKMRDELKELVAKAKEKN
jgi:hypothetical protein